uniref:P-type phospholipid transporter n=1 Tax=Denticeps clupeoides TaxID=299321 RepID=A0AAY4A836_9TELE
MRQKVRLLVELLWPLFLFFILVQVRSSNHPIYKGQCHYPNKAMPSAGVLPWLQGIICNLDNPCINYPTPGEAPGQVNNFKSSVIAEMLIQLQSLVSSGSIFTTAKQLSIEIDQWALTKLENGQPLPLKSLLRDNETFTSYLRENLTVSTVTAQTLMMASVRLNKISDLSKISDVKLVLCNGSTIQQYVQFSTVDDMTAFQEIICSKSPQQLSQARDVFQQNMDMRKLTRSVSLSISKVQKVFLRATDGLNFRDNMFGSLKMLLCGNNPDFNLTNATLGRSNSHVFIYTGEFCQMLIDTLEGTPGLRYIWSTFRPLLQGKVLFTPDTAVTRQLVTEANSTFKALATLRTLADAWVENKMQIWEFFQNGQQINVLRTSIHIHSFSLFSPIYRPAGMQPFDWRDVFNATSKILEQLGKFIGCLDLDKFEAVSSEGKLVEKALKLLAEKRFWAGIVFDGLQPDASHPPPYIKYKIRMDIEDVERTNKIKDRSWYPGARDNSFNDLRYVWGGFAYLQDMVDHGIVRAHSGKAKVLGVFAQQMPYPCYVDDVFILSIGGMLPMFLVLSFMDHVCMTIKDLVLEKEKRLKEVLRAAGVRSSALWFAWFSENFIILTVVCALISVMVKFGKVLRYSDPSVIFVFLVVFCVATIMQCFFISVFFSRANLAAACGGLIYFVLYLPHVLCYAWKDVMSFGPKIAVSLLSSVAFGYGCENFARYEEQGIGIQWHNIGRSTEEGDPYSFIVSIFMLLIDALLYWLLTWYIESVFPGQYGIPKPWYFPFTRSYWCGTTLGVAADPGSLNDLQHNGYHEKPPPNMKAGVSIRNLVKIYKTGKKLAVDGLSLDFYENQITSFLGHNGAGKTTTMSILTGLFAPTSGTAFINGYDIRTDMDTIRKHLGMCPQHNVLFNDLTVEEHIYFYARLKGQSSKEVKAEIDQMIEDVGLPHKRHELARNLSGGMQRKLSVAIAFIGKSSIVILDEPTAGVDPYARRGIWELLLKYKQGRTIILSTHHMDEADILGDRIAIISNGRMCCCGSSLFLKKCFGSGYYLTLVRASEEKMASQRNGLLQFSKRFCMDEGIGNENSRCTDPSDLADVCNLVRRYVPEAVFLESIGQEVTYILPYSGARDGTFANLFKNLDLEMSNLKITSYGISDTTLEEVLQYLFCTIEGFVQDWKQSSRESRHHSIATTKGSVENVTSVTGKGSGIITGWRLIRKQFWALFIKRFHHARRSRKGLVAQVVLPALFVCLSLIFSLIVPPFTEYPNLELQPWIYGAPQNTFFSNDMPDNAEVLKVTDTLVNNPGFGTRCMQGNPIPNLPCMPGAATAWFTPDVDPAIKDIFNNGNWSMSNPSPSCMCSTPSRSIMLPDCPPGAGGLPPRQKTQKTTDTLQDLTGMNVTDFLLKTYERSGKKRYGGISVGEVNSQVKLNGSEIAAILRDLKGLLSPSQHDNNMAANMIYDYFVLYILQVWFYNQGWHAMISFLNVANNGILRGNLPPDVDPSLYGISVSSHPLNLTKEQLATTSTDVVVSICVIFAMSFIPASFVLFLIQERVTKAKHLQFVSGVNPAVYWVASFAWDMCNYVVPCVIVIVIFLCFQQKAYVSPPNLPALILLLVLYGWSITPMMYPASFWFSVPSTAYVVLTCINLFIGINGSVATFVMEMFDDESITRINNIIKQVLLIFPHFCLGRGLIDMAKNQAMATLFLGEDRFKDPLSWDMVGKNLFAMSVEGVVMFAITLLIQYKFFCKPRVVTRMASSLEQEDEDVAQERIRVHQEVSKGDLLRICDLTKVYRGKRNPAVDRICVGIPAAECFGLLGINGAGKTTTFKMLTGDIAASSGEAFLNGYSIQNEMRDVHQNMGYCPQFDAINELLTGREHLEFYGRLRGVPEREVPMVAEWGIQKLGLVKYANKTAGTYSGGNKRKLSTAMALIGCPPVVFLDEPTTGMDPRARRFLWDCILSVIKEGRSVVLTSHSMEECEALCTRMAIMVNGRFKCLGSIQHLKSKFGEGYTLIVRVAGSPPALGPVEDFVRETFSGSILKEKHHNTLHYQLVHQEGALTTIFNKFNMHQERLGIEDYSVSQTTLDQVFVNFAKHQHEDEEEDVLTYNNPVDISDEVPMQGFKHSTPDGS